MADPLEAKLRDVQALLNSIVEARGNGGEGPSHWELPVLPPPDADGQLSSTDLLNWWFRAPHQQREEALETPAQTERPAPPTASDRWTDLSLLFPEMEEHLAEEHAQAAVDCLYDFLHALGERDIDAAAALIDERYHAIDDGEEIDKGTFTNTLASQIDGLRDWDFDVSLAVAPEAINHPNGVLIHAVVQFDGVHRTDGAKDGHVEERLAIVRQDEDGEWKIAGLPRVRP